MSDEERLHEEIERAILNPRAGMMGERFLLASGGDAVASVALTAEDLEALMQKLWDAPISRVCQHAVHPKAEGWTVCGMCWRPVHQATYGHRECDGTEPDCLADGMRRMYGVGAS